MRNQTNKAEALLSLIRRGEHMTFKQQLELTIRLSIPAVVAQISYIVMQYIDASMVGSLGAEASASIGLVSTSTWLFWGVCVASATGFSVQVAHHIGAKEFGQARAVLRQSFVATTIFSLLLTVIGVLVSTPLPAWLGGDVAIQHDASSYFLIYPSRELEIGNISVFVSGAGLGVEGAALGTGLAEMLAAIMMTWYLCRCSKELALVGRPGSFFLTSKVLIKSFKIGAPMCVEHIVICGAQILTTVIVAPLGIFAIAANSFAITAESLCYMPGYGIADAATTLIGQSLGAGRKDLTRSFARITVATGMLVMGVMGGVMYWAAPLIIGAMTPDAEILSLGVMALRIEAFAEPMFAAAIVAYGVFIGTGDTLMPSIMNFVSIWAVRLSLASCLAPSMGLKGVWLAMCIELCFRGMIFLIRLEKGKWIKIT